MTQANFKLTVTGVTLWRASDTVTGSGTPAAVGTSSHGSSWPRDSKFVGGPWSSARLLTRPRVSGPPAARAAATGECHGAACRKLLGARVPAAGPPRSRVGRPPPPLAWLLKSGDASGLRRTSSVARGDFCRKFKNARCPSAASAALRRFTKDASLSDLQSGESSLIMNFDLRCCHHFGLAHSMVSWFRCNLVEFVHCETMHTHDIIDLAWLLACIIIIAICFRVVSSVIQV